MIKLMTLEIISFFVYLSSFIVVDAFTPSQAPANILSLAYVQLDDTGICLKPNC